MFKMSNLCFVPSLTSLVLFRMHLALKAYQELLLTVNQMDCSQDESIRQSSSVIKCKMLTDLINFEYFF